MPGLGFKLVDRSREEIVPIVERAMAGGCPLEVGFYFTDLAARQYLLTVLPRSGLRVNAHLDHRRLSLLGIQSKEAELREQLELAAAIGASFVLTHLGNFPMASRPASRGRLWERLALDLDFAESIAADYGLGLHIENTFHALPFYRELCASLLGQRGRALHLCFDLGHAKVWSEESLAEWLAFLASQAEIGARLHFHLHANQGLADEHLSFVTTTRLGLTGVDDFTQGLDWFQALDLLDRRFPESSKVFEVPPAEAIENYELVVANLESLRAQREGP